MDIANLREDVRSYLANHELSQELLARELDVSYSWLNKFCLGQFDNVRIQRLERLIQWVADDRVKRGLVEPERRSA